MLKKVKSYNLSAMIFNPFIFENIATIYIFLLQSKYKNYTSLSKYLKKLITLIRNCS